MSIQDQVCIIRLLSSLPATTYYFGEDSSLNDSQMVVSPIEFDKLNLFENVQDQVKSILTALLSIHSSNDTTVSNGLVEPVAFNLLAITAFLDFSSSSM